MNVAFYGHPEAEQLMQDGIPLEEGSYGCPDRHICLGWSPNLSANFGPVIVVNVDDLPGLEWEQGEGRVHEPIDARRCLGILSPHPEANWKGWSDPAERFNHRACLERLRAVQR